MIYNFEQLPQVDNIEHVRTVYDYIKSNPDLNCDDYLKTVPNKLKRNKYKDKLEKAFRYIKTLKDREIPEHEWIVKNEYVIPRNMVTEIRDVQNRKRPIQSNEDVASVKKIKLNNYNDSFYNLVLDNSKQLFDFPQNVMNEADELFKHYNELEFKYKFLSVIGNGGCGRKTLIQYIAKKYDYGVVYCSKDSLCEDSLKSFFNRYYEEDFKMIIVIDLWNTTEKQFGSMYKLGDILNCIFKDKIGKLIIAFKDSKVRTFIKRLDYIKFPKLTRDSREKYIKLLFNQNNSCIKQDICHKLSRWTNGFELEHLIDFVNVISKNIDVNNIDWIKVQLNKIKEGLPSNLLLPAGDVTFENIGGHEAVKQNLKISISQLLDETRQEKTSGILLYGPPGTGKTTLAKALSNEMEYGFISVSISDILDKYQGASEQNVCKWFDKAENCTPCILFFDEIDALFCQRSEDNQGSTNNVVNMFLTYLDGMSSQQNKKVLVIGATNHINLIDKGFLRPMRLGNQIFVDIPRFADERYRVMESVIDTALPKEEKYSPMEIKAIIKKLSDDLYTEDLSQAHLNELAVELINLYKQKQKIDFSMTLPIIKKFRVYNKNCYKASYSEYKFAHMTDFPNNKYFMPYPKSIEDKLQQYYQLIERDSTIHNIGMLVLAFNDESLIKQIAKKFQRNLLIIHNVFFSKFPIDILFKMIKQYSEDNGDTFVVVDTTNNEKLLEALKSYKNLIKSSNDKLDILIVTSINYQMVYSEIERKTIFENEIKDFISESQLKYLVDLTKDFDRQDFQKITLIHIFEVVVLHILDIIKKKSVM